MPTKKTEQAAELQETPAPIDNDTTWQRIMEGLSKPFHPSHIHIKPGKVSSNGQALALWYVDARAVMDRLDTVVGSGNWQFSWQPIPSDDGHVVVQGMLTILGVTKSDVGEAKDEDEPWKAGVSDSFKRTAVQFGIGRFLYRLPQIWWPYDNQSRRFAQLDELAEFVEKVTADLVEVDGDATQINIKDYANMIPRDREHKSSTQYAGGNGNKGDLTPAQEGYIRRLYNQRFGQLSNGNAVFANFLKQSIGRVCTIEKLTRAEADTIIKALQDLANAA